jgi:putative aldouronate transport system permease protein
MLVLKLGGILGVNTEQVLLLYNPTVYKTGDVLGTYIYRTGVALNNYSYATAIGLFESLVGLVLVLTGNALSRRISGRSVW